MAIRAFTSTEMVSGSQDSRGGIDVMRRRHNLMLYANSEFSPCPYFQQIFFRTYK